MGILSWMFYIFLGVLFFIIIGIFNSKYSLSKLQSIAISIFLLLIVSGFCVRFNLSCSENIFLSFVFLMLSDLVYSSYFIEKDFFNKEESKLAYYIVLIFVGFFINQEFINKVDSVFLTGEDFRIVLWLLMIVFIYSFFKDKNIMNSGIISDKNNMSINSILSSYAKYKYMFFDECNISNRELSNALYAMIIFESSRKSKLLRNIDNFNFKVDGKMRKLGIMQVESKKFISDSESIDIVRKKIEKIYKSKKNKDINDLFDEYYGYDNEKVKYIFDIIKKF